ncbi:hypothetical protein [Polaromonas sp.]|uniref:hypothetical protein n=1 Tax=Polaromonas sp. TaxID=1869339 RepID=UPI003267A7A6
MIVAAVEMKICRSIDHVMLRLLDMEPLFSLLTETLRLPVTWSLQHSEFASFSWVHVGNTHLELWAARNNGDLPAECRLPLIHGLALEPDELAFSTAELERRGMACKPPRPYQAVNEVGQSITNFTNSVVFDLSSPTNCNFFCEWGLQASIVPWAKGVSTRERRDAEQRRFASMGGGPIGLVRLARVGVTCPDVARMKRHWRAVAQTEEDEALAIGGVALAFQPGDQHQIDSLSLEVRSLAEAQKFLQPRGLLERETTDTLTLCERATGGLVIHVVEADEAATRT